MRERWVYIVAVFTGVMVTLLALAFAWMHAPPERPQGPVASPEPAPPSALVESGRAVYEAQGCARCHSIAGAGNPRNPLDGVGRRLGAGALRDWILATGPAEESLPAPVVRAKQSYRRLDEAEIAALVAYMQHLTNGPSSASGGTDRASR